MLNCQTIPNHLSLPDSLFESLKIKRGRKSRISYRNIVFGLGILLYKMVNSCVDDKRLSQLIGGTIQNLTYLEHHDYIKQNALFNSTQSVVMDKYIMSKVPKILNMIKSARIHPNSIKAFDHRFFGVIDWVDQDVSYDVVCKPFFCGKCKDKYCKKMHKLTKFRVTKYIEDNVPVRMKIINDFKVTHTQIPFDLVRNVLRKSIEYDFGEVLCKIFGVPTSQVSDIIKSANFTQIQRKDGRGRS